jgi:hypothetical protein
MNEHRKGIAMKKSIYLAILFLLIFSNFSYAATEDKTKCPTKVLLTKTIEGIYQGIYCGDECFPSIKQSDGKEFVFICDEDVAESFFGEEGNTVSLTYELTQMMLNYNQSESICVREPVCKSGKILSKKK